MNEDWPLLAPVEHELTRLRRQLEVWRLGRIVDEDPELCEVEQVLRLKRGCRR